MQKRLLSLVVITTMIFPCAVSYAQETVPVISEAQHAENKKKYEELKNNINALDAQILASKTERDALESLLFSHDERNKFEEQLFNALTGEDKALAQLKKNSNENVSSVRDQRKKRNNGIERAWFSGVTEPIPGSPVAEVYARAEKNANQQIDILEKIFIEHEKYKNIVEKEILPTTKDDLLRRINVIELSYIPAFRKCCSDDEYYRCLANEGINKEQVSENFVDNFVRASYVAAYRQAIKKGVPCTQEKVTTIVEKNKITKEAAANLAIIAEELKKAIRGEQGSLPILQEPEDKSSIFGDPKEDQNDQGSLSE